jgi:hypothetical protein
LFDIAWRCLQALSGSYPLIEKDSDKDHRVSFSTEVSSTLWEKEDPTFYFQGQKKKRIWMENKAKEEWMYFRNEIGFRDRLFLLMVTVSGCGSNGLMQERCKDGLVL